jgi:hypothetical protein
MMMLMTIPTTLTAETIIVNFKRDNYYGDDVVNCCCCRGLQPCNNSIGGGGSQPCSCSLLPGPEYHLQEGTPPFFLIFLLAWKIKLPPKFQLIP